MHADHISPAKSVGTLNSMPRNDSSDSLAARHFDNKCAMVARLFQDGGLG